MPRALDRAVLASVCVLLVIVMGSSLSGAGPGVVGWIHTQNGTATIDTSPTSSTSFTRSTSHTTSIATSRQSTSVRTSQTQSTSTQSSQTTSQGGGPSTSGFDATLGLVSWYALAGVVVLLAAVAAAVISRLQRPKIFDLKGVVEEMQARREEFSSSFSQKLRNSALLRYYLLVVQACGRLGVADAPEDTPREFLSRASAELGVEAGDTARFAEAVDRAHYGGELTSSEVEEAAGFMDSFTQGIVRRAGVG